MIIYTPLLMEEVLKNQEHIKELKEIEYQGIKLQVEPSEDKYKVVRIISTDPEHFINPEIQPGMILEANF